MGACSGKAAKTHQSREIRIGDLKDGYQYSPLESNDWDAATSAASRDRLDIVQFSAPIFVAAEGEPFSIQVMRLGSLAGRVSCCFKTVASSGKAGKRYVHSEGEIIFEDGEFQHSIDLDILNSPTWSATLEFKVMLENPLSCQLGRYLKTCRIKVMDSDTFPTSAYAEELTQGPEKIENMNRALLHLEFLKLMLAVPGNTSRFIVTCLFDQLKNAYVWFTLVSSVYMVNVIFGKDPSDQAELLIPGDPERTAQVLGVMYIALPVLLHVWKVAKLKMDVKGHCKLFLQTSIMRKYMNYSEESRAETTQHEVQKFIVQNASDLAESVDEVSGLFETMWKLVMLNYFAVSSDPGMLWAVLLMPAVMAAWTLFREKILRKPEHPDLAQKLVADLVAEISENYSLIAGYFQRPSMNEKFAARANKLSDVLLPRALYDLRSDFFFEWLGPLLVGFYLCFYSPQVLSGKLSLGTFLATISVFKEVSNNFFDFFAGIKSIVSKFEPLVEITVFLNRPTDVQALKDQVEFRVRETGLLRKKLLQEPDPGNGVVRTDLIPIRLEDLSFKFASTNHHILSGANIAVNQGKLVAIVGAAGSGKTKLIRLLASEIAPTSGRVLIPSHLRCLLVTHKVFLMNTSPLQNLFFGDPSTIAQPEERHRMMWILDKLRMDRTRQLAEKEIEILQEPPELEQEPEGCCNFERPTPPADPPHARWTPQDGSFQALRVEHLLHGWRESLSFQEKAKIHIARALIMNPEIMILEKPLMNFDENEAALVASVLKEYVANRGVAMPVDSYESRRPRSCFYSAERLDMETCPADTIWRHENGKITEDGLEDPKKKKKQQRSAQSPKSIS
mmetsp:Transcript_20945/g.48821  ORF Transcript_20945/g.48821 Transcript_20945/m.48821 type:complete len:844 (-) Transcript_20945:340-2871(-)